MSNQNPQGGFAGKNDPGGRRIGVQPTTPVQGDARAAAFVEREKAQTAAVIATAPVLQPRTVVQLQQAYGSVFPGEIAGYEPDEAGDLIRRGIAVYHSGPKPSASMPVRPTVEEQQGYAVHMERLSAIVKQVRLNPGSVGADGRPDHKIVQTMMGMPVNPADIDLVMGQLANG